MGRTENGNGEKRASRHQATALLAHGQGLWLDFVTRELARGGELARLIDDGLRGMTSNPTIFDKAISAGQSYDDQIRELASGGASAEEILEATTVTDIQGACDLFRPVYDRTGGADGFVSIEVSPRLARSTEGSLVHARRLWSAVGRPNVMVKVPGTNEGAPAIRELLREGINVNITLLFSRANHERVMDAYLGALEERFAAGEAFGRIASVASFFVSRVDTAVDKLLQRKLEDAAAAGDHPREALIRRLFGKAATANAKLAYQRFREIFGGDRFARLAAHGARVQRPLWASTSTKNPAYRDLMYVEELIGPDTVNTLPLETLRAFLERGQVRPTLTEGVDEARATLEALAAAGIDLDAVTAQLEDEGIASFTKSYESLLAGVEKKREQLKARGTRELRA